VLAFCFALRYQAIMNKYSIDQLAMKLAETVPQGMKLVRDDLEDNFRAVLRSGLARLDLVTREEFEVQQAVLARTREKLDLLEARLSRLGTPAGKPAAKTAAKPVGKKKTAKKKSRKKTAGKKKARKKA